MKKYKILFSLLLALIISLTLCCVASAYEIFTLEISEDYKTVIYRGEEYFFVPDGDVMSSIYYEDIVSNVDVLYTEKQKAYIESAAVSEKGNGLELEILFKETDNLEYIYYWRSSAREEYLALIEGRGETCEIYDKSFAADDLFGERVTIPALEAMSQFGNMWVQSFDSTHAFYTYSGLVLYNNSGDCYYLSYFENGTNNYYFDFMNFDELVVHKVTNPDVYELVRGNYTAPDTSDHSKLILTAVALAAFFLVAPLAIGAFCTIKLRRAAEHYRRILKIVSCFAYATAASFVILAVVVLLVI